MPVKKRWHKIKKRPEWRNEHFEVSFTGDRFLLKTKGGQAIETKGVEGVTEAINRPRRWWHR